MTAEDVRGSAPAMTTKELIQRLHDAMYQEVLPYIAVQKSQDLDRRVTALELAKAGEAGQRQARDGTIGISRATLALVVSMVVPALLLVQTGADLILKALGVHR